MAQEGPGLGPGRNSKAVYSLGFCAMCSMDRLPSREREREGERDRYIQVRVKPHTGFEGRILPRFWQEMFLQESSSTGQRADGNV